MLHWLPGAVGQASAFAPPMDQEISGSANQRLGTDLAVGDFDGDGFDDLAAHGSGSCDVHFGGAAGLDPVAGWTASAAGFSMVVLDADGDGFDDLALTNGGRIEVYLGSAAGLGAAPAWTRNTNDSDVRIAGGDTNGDGFDDLVLNRWGGYLTWFLEVHRGYSGGLRAAVHSSVGGPLGAVSTADVDGDGFKDVVSGDPYDSGARGGRVLIRRGSANGVAANPAWIVTNPNNFYSPGIGDFLTPAGDLNGDGYDDLATNLPTSAVDPFTLYHLHETFIVFGGAGGPSTLIVHTAYGVSLDAAIVPDVDGDGRDELTMGYSDARLNGTPRGGAAIFPRGFLPPAGPDMFCVGDVGEGAGASVGAGDFDGDGATDWAVGALPDPAGKIGVRYGL